MNNLYRELAPVSDAAWADLEEEARRTFGTYFIGYARSPHRIEQMLSNMFVGRPPGNYDRLLDFSRATTGTLFFVPSATFLDNVAAPAPVGKSLPPEDPLGATSRTSSSDGSLGIGSLKNEAGHE